MLKRRLKTLVLVIVGIFVLSGCAKTYTVEIHKKKDQSISPKKIALFLDGTANNMQSRTNISKLFEITANQNRDNLYLFYNEGVGTGGRVLGAATGWGIGKDVREAYNFLTQYYKGEKNTKLYIFGFSRGAYTARILAGMIYTVGIYDLSMLNEKERKDVIYELYSYAYKGKGKTKEKIYNKASKIIKEWSKEKGFTKKLKTVNYDNTKIEILGLWDSVEALGLVPTLEAVKDKLHIEQDKQNIVDPNGRYFDQLCNVENALHALSLDDNRAYVFTPIILTSEYLIQRCEPKNKTKEDIERSVNEVWFSGAHADIGGESYHDNSFISGISLNWMIQQISKIEDNKDPLLPRGIKIYEDINGIIHDAENFSLFEKILYREKKRIDILNRYLDESIYRQIKIHNSALQRIKESNSQGFDSQWYKAKIFKECDKNSLESCKIIKVETNRSN